MQRPCIGGSEDPQPLPETLKPGALRPRDVARSCARGNHPPSFSFAKVYPNFGQSPRNWHAPGSSQQRGYSAISVNLNVTSGAGSTRSRRCQLPTTMSWPTDITSVGFANGAWR